VNNVQFKDGEPLADQSDRAAAWPAIHRNWQ